MKDLTKFIIESQTNSDTLAIFVLKGKKDDKNHLVYIPYACVQWFYTHEESEDTTIGIRSPKDGFLHQYYCAEHDIFFGTGNPNKICPSKWIEKYKDLEEYDDTKEYYPDLDAKEDAYKI